MLTSKGKKMVKINLSLLVYEFYEVGLNGISPKGYQHLN